MNDRLKGRKAATEMLHPNAESISDKLQRGASASGDAASFIHEHDHHNGRFSAPVLNEMIKGVVDALIDSGEDLQNPSSAKYTYAIPTTRQEFDSYYDAQRKKGVKNPYHGIASAAKLLKTPDLLESNARIVTDGIVSTLIPIAQELEKRGISSKRLLEETSRTLFKPAEIDLSMLDPKLRISERKYIEYEKKLSLLYGALELEPGVGLLASTEKDAPAGSSWAERVRRNTQEVALGALENIIKNR